MRFSRKFRVRPDHNVKPDRIDPNGRDDALDKGAAEPIIRHYVERFRALQSRLYTENSHSLLICLQAIEQFDRHLSEGGAYILKFFLHISREEQLRRFRKRLDDSGRWWKISGPIFRSAILERLPACLWGCVQALQ